MWHKKTRRIIMIEREPTIEDLKAIEREMEMEMESYND